ncbi:hypothetical protein PRCB_18835 [Pantoea rodasii]|uniref:Uncharacterized protein n=1 Tax=Pantoea rodasii TaxID=1076549 RepID=A0A2M9W8U5_9GAMM|nr:hypothetical protein PRCB_18835 [Pantoea rodasii]
MTTQSSSALQHQISPTTNHQPPTTNHQPPTTNHSSPPVISPSPANPLAPHPYFDNDIHSQLSSDG